MERKGLSDIVVVVLIVLLTLVAISLVWIFIRSGVDTSGGGIEKGIIFSSVRFSIIPGSLSVTNGDVVFLLERNSGAGEIDGVVIVLEDDLGNSSLIDKYRSTSIQELARLRVNITYLEHGLSGNVTRVSVYPSLIIDGETITPDNPSVGLEVPLNSVSGTTPPAPSCGDGNIDAGEQCDGSNLGGATCVSEGFVGGGTLACDGSCNFDTSGCLNYISLNACPPTGLDIAGAEYRLTQDITSIGLDCFVFTASNVVLDGQGFRVNGAGIEYGADISTTTGGIIKNVEFQGFDLGIVADSSAGSLTLENVTSCNNVQDIQCIDGVVTLAPGSSLNASTVSCTDIVPTASC